MRKRHFLLAFVLVAALFIALPVGAASWAHKVTGGGQASAGGIDFSITVSAWKDGDGASAGNIEYDRPGVNFHAKVECMGVFDGGSKAVAAGPGWNQEGTSWLNEGNWVIVNVHEGGVGAGDEVRVYQGSSENAMASCSDGPVGGFPGTVFDGNFNIRSK